MRHLLSCRRPCFASPTPSIKVGKLARVPTTTLASCSVHRAYWVKALPNRAGIIDQSKGVDIYVPTVCWLVRRTQESKYEWMNDPCACMDVQMNSKVSTLLAVPLPLCTIMSSVRGLPWELVLLSAVQFAVCCVGHMVGVELSTFFEYVQQWKREGVRIYFSFNWDYCSNGRVNACVHSIDVWAMPSLVNHGYLNKTASLHTPSPLSLFNLMYIARIPIITHLTHIAIFQRSYIQMSYGVLKAYNKLTTFWKSA